MQQEGQRGGDGEAEQPGGGLQEELSAEIERAAEADNADVLAPGDDREEGQDQQDGLQPRLAQQVGREQAQPGDEQGGQQAAGDLEGEGGVVVVPPLVLEPHQRIPHAELRQALDGAGDGGGQGDDAEILGRQQAGEDQHADEAKHAADHAPGHHPSGAGGDARGDGGRLGVSVRHGFALRRMDVGLANALIGNIASDPGPGPMRSTS